MTDIIGGATNSEATDDLIKDSTIETFQADVLDASKGVPVVVDFWASWCGPCRTLGPLLEAQVKARSGKVRMVKVDTDKNQMLAQQLRIQSLPTVMAFVAGQPVDGFMGALPESQISDFLDRLLATAEQAGLTGGQEQAPDSQSMIEMADKALEAQDLTTALQAYGAAAEMSEAGSDIQVTALAGMARAALLGGDQDQARHFLSLIPESHKDMPEVTQVSAMMSLASREENTEEVAEAQSSATQNPDDPAAQYALGEALADSGDSASAMTALLRSIELDRDWQENAAREKLLTIFEALGAADPNVKSARRKLSSILFA